MIVMKFGGTSVESAEAIDRVAGIVRGRLDRRPTVVVSAMSKATDQLLAMAAAAGAGDKEKAVTLCQALRDRHFGVASALVSDASNPVHTSIAADYLALEQLLEGICAVGELTPRTQDNVVAYGERINSKVVAAAFAARGLKATHVDAREIIVTDHTFGKATPQVAEIDRRLMAKVKPLIDDGVVPVLGGFIGSTPDGITTTIGRGGSDFSAALVGAGLNAEAIEIWTDVDGMKTTDPNLCPDAHRIKVISFEEAAELAYFGAKVLHPATVLPAIEKNIPVYVLNSRNPSNEGTKIVARAPQTRNPFKAIAAKKRITVIDVVAARMLMAHGFLRQIFEIFDRHKCAVDVVSTSEVSVSLTVDSNERIPEIAADMEKLAFVKYSGRKAIVCLVGENIRERPGIAAQVFTAISDINVRMISQGASEINITFVIDEADVPEAVRRLHAHFFTDVDPEVFD
ncbi:aspartate kinase [Candidatus Koribacter versatilis Ellin345]|uniref:Aspartokinase n=1 Tax=Koribacter versatilis (strain Ellin345) TaxID=204669 RepID=Q1INQ8_KORVE|nr:lysine-sensitive aspartokinase 3 [Candidatus Koribacter versatilis]ABF41492.1 aspartate kinase [Candidatus Koribacter versatilis Ellin345]